MAEGYVAPRDWHTPEEEKSALELLTKIEKHRGKATVLSIASFLDECNAKAKETKCKNCGTNFDPHLKSTSCVTNTRYKPLCIVVTYACPKCKWELVIEKWW